MIKYAGYVFCFVKYHVLEDDLCSSEIKHNVERDVVRTTSYKQNHYEMGILVSVPDNLFPFRDCVSYLYQCKNHMKGNRDLLLNSTIVVSDGPIE